MKKQLFVFAGLFLLSLVLKSQSEFTAIFKTSGNCSICETRIENAVNELDGIVAVHWSYTNDRTTVTYDTTIIDCHTIMQTIANVGHDTEWYQAPDTAYEPLIGTCCQYARIFTYDDVQIGWLSILGVWVYPLVTSISNTFQNPEVRIFPNPAQEYIQVSLENSSSEYYTKIVDMKGRVLVSGNFSNNEKINIDNLPTGTHLVIISKDDEPIFIKPLIKQ